jgi:hypothetical protein
VRDRQKRIQSVAALEQELRNVMEGHIRISCHITLTKRVMHEFVRWVDRHPGTYSLLLLGFVLLLVTSLGLAGYQAIR